MDQPSLKSQLPEDKYLPGLSVDCVIIGFHNGTLKILLNKFNTNNKWMLPGGFVLKDENIDDAAYRHLKNRTGLKEVFLKQFHTFGDSDRTDIEENKSVLQKRNVPKEKAEWYLNRFVTIAYYALVEYSTVSVFSNTATESVEWFELSKLPELYGDHRHIIEKSLSTLQFFVGHIPIGYELLPKKFTMPELRIIYETILRRSLDRRNFQRKMLSLGLFNKLNETRKCGAHKSPHLYEFNEKKYKTALEYGFNLVLN